MRDSGKGMVDPVLLSSAISDFQQARAQAALQTVTSRLRGKSIELLSFDDVAARLHVTGKSSAGRRAIPLNAIVGSVGRYTDFTRTFLPRRNWDAQRWAHVRAASEVTELPPIDVYQIGEAYFVLDGNHRVSIARRQGATHIDAIITTVQTRVPLTPQDNPDSLIVKSEHARFLAATRLDQLRPGSDVRVSAAGQYAHLENLIEVHRYFQEEERQEAIDDREAVTCWYDDAYLPVVEVIREQGILRYFPGRTETDLYVFIATHQAQLRKDMGWLVAPQVAAADLLETAAPRRPLLSRFAAWARKLLGRQPASMFAPGSWSQQHIAARYSGQLFADILVSYQAEETDREALAQALLFARREDSRILGLQVRNGVQLPAGSEGSFYRQCQTAGLDAQLAQESGPWILAICRRAPLADVVVAASEIVTGNGTLESLLQATPRPLLLVPGAARPVNRLLLYYDGGEKSREALFAAAYMAEEWRVELLVLIAEPYDKYHPALQAYLELHELDADILSVEPGWQGLVGAGEQHGCDLLVLGYPGRGSRDQLEITAFGNLLRKCDRPLLVCT